jgi:hypothetical protein
VSRESRLTDGREHLNPIERGGKSMRIPTAIRLLSVAGMTLFGASVHADTAYNLDVYNTGMSTTWVGPQSPINNSPTGIKLEGSPAIQDTHWSVTKSPNSPAINGNTYVLNDQNASGSAYEAPFAPYGTFVPSVPLPYPAAQYDLGADPNKFGSSLDGSQWISGMLASGTNGYAANSTVPVGGAEYVYTTTFSTLASTSLISISGFIKAGYGDALTKISLNGTDYPVFVTPGYEAADTPFQFSISQVGGLANTLSFYVTHSGGLPGGTSGMEIFRLQFENATAMTVPEPSTFALGALSLFGFGAMRWRRRNNKVAEQPIAG